jgi:hypothetical protein
LFRKAHEENCKQAEVDKKKAEKEAEMEKTKGTSKSARDKEGKADKEAEMEKAKGILT